MTCNQKYHATGCYVKALHMMNQSIESTCVRISLMSNCTWIILEKECYIIQTTLFPILIGAGIRDIHIAYEILTGCLFIWKIRYWLKENQALLETLCYSYMYIIPENTQTTWLWCFNKTFFFGVSTLRKPIKKQNTLYRAKQFISITKINTAFPKCTRRNI